MFRLAHLSDPHIGPLPAASVRELASKRVLGYINWHRNRAVAMKGDLLARLVAAVHATAPDHVAVTGDLVNIALAAELEPARAFLETIGPGGDVTVVPGNHDAYVPGALVKATAAWCPWIVGDADHGSPSWPTVRRRGDVALIGVSTARASSPFMATGHVSVQQATRLCDRLEQLGREGLFRVVMIHHPPIRGSTDWHKRLVGGSRVRAAIRAHGAELVLHGHTHLATRMELAGPDGPVPVIGVPSASQEPGGHKPGAGFNLFEIERRNDGWRVGMVEHRILRPGGDFVVVGEHGYRLTRGASAATQTGPILNQA
ncbi:metallophosphoesterase family protein [Oharaeibacter diazotrophicus]|uniref:3',5'-cyclic AMP phosphodiesterase CpdA n=1 Tax=Oharaeibacter diazotrophicus TaxID=1920512 RepID=A0A4R6RBP3_9HYPH|nr:metallophosphoesterase [Oharaeibacter diazotrophicus]TDP83563.1 3',5'-cyclic AMP phosphodiesterase CpdA [Oharaeibacter diazotrophicus]BBE72396.1 calcineurin-like phosphoesterase [Pleomorphomonas sp. SM30]GLS79166.1 metallophosphatase [Oharaeibacter diazotrophicus]